MILQKYKRLHKNKKNKNVKLLIRDTWICKKKQRHARFNYSSIYM